MKVLYGLVRFFAFLVLVWSEIGLVTTATNQGGNGLWILVAYWGLSVPATWLVYRLLDHFASTDIARIVKPLVLSLFFFPLWLFWGFVPLPMAFFWRFPTGSAAFGILLIAIVWVPLGAVILLLSRPVWSYPSTVVKVLSARSKREAAH
jgi:hypothetical protein